jgi:hypothetical protein
MKDPTFIEKWAGWIRSRSDFVLVFLSIGLVALLLVLTVAIASAGEVDLSWQAPTTNEDGTPLTDLAGFTVYYYDTSGGWASPIGNQDVGNVTAATMTVPSQGNVYFIVTAYDTSGNESGPSNEVVADFLSPGTATSVTVDGVRK